jgi:hypothetical protein
MANPSTANTLIRRSNDLLCGRLVALPSNTTAQQLFSGQGLQTAISVDFPAMPDTIELARSTDYIVNNNIVAPDGIHQYKATRSLEIPILFKLHSFDDKYCAKGSLTLLQLAARLHSFVLPISTYSGHAQIQPIAGSQPTTNASGDSLQVGKSAEATQQSNGQAAVDISQSQITSTSGPGSINPPATCWLHLMWTDENQPGISCVGYVKDVRVVFSGPWLRGINSSFNLPTSAEFSFTFIHVPGYGNAQGFNTSTTLAANTTTVQAYADDVGQTLYNTQALVQATSYQGLSNPPSPTAPPTATTTPAASTVTSTAVFQGPPA